MALVLRGEEVNLATGIAGDEKLECLGITAATRKAVAGEGG